jgi:hypothetical protein
MHDYLFDTELVCLSVVLGIIIGVLIYERLGWTMGGVVGLYDHHAYARGAHCQ